MFDLHTGPASDCSGLSRRQFLRVGGLSSFGLTLPGFLRMRHLTASEGAPPAKAGNCILLWMDGGPSHIDTFDPKPDAPAEVRGDLGSIATAVPGLRVGEKFPKFARLMKHAALLRGMSSEEGDHARARVYAHTGYRPGAGGLNYPTLGSTVSAERGRADFELPNFVVTGTPLGKHDFLSDPGYRGPRHQPLVLGDPGAGLKNLKSPAATDDFDDRVGVLEELEKGFTRTLQSDAAEARRAAWQGAVRLMRSDKARAFDLS